MRSRATRLEFQDGKRKPAQQAYHGRGTVHSHSLDFLENVGCIGLEEKMSAHLPDEVTQAGFNMFVDFLQFLWLLIFADCTYKHAYIHAEMQTCKCISRPGFPSRLGVGWAL